MRGCQVCGSHLAEDWLDDFCAPCVDRLHQQLATILLRIHEPPYRLAPSWNQLLQRLRRRSRRKPAA